MIGLEDENRSQKHVKFQISKNFDQKTLKEIFIKNGHVRINSFLEEVSAKSLAHHIQYRNDWKKIINSDDKIFEIDQITLNSMSNDQRTSLEKAVHESARFGFQFCYSAIRSPETKEVDTPGDLLKSFVQFMASPEVIDLVRNITDQHAINFADGQATRYESGDFLTAHDDAVTGKNRHAAYVFGLTRDWRNEWGGLLLLHGNDSSFSGEAPRFNSLDLFRVPSVHSVTYVTPFAAHARTSVTGWFRTQ